MEQPITAAKLAELQPGRKEDYAMAKFCTHVALSHEKPQDCADAYDNLTRVISVVQGLFWVTHGTLSGQDNQVAEVAGLGVDLCEELSRRAAMLYELSRAAHAATVEPEKEG